MLEMLEIAAIQVQQELPYGIRGFASHFEVSPREIRMDRTCRTDLGKFAKIRYNCGSYDPKGTPSTNCEYFEHFEVCF